jgi:hypothetical protein
MNKLERKAYQQINLNEGLISVLAKFFLGGKFRDAMRELEKMKKDDPELKAALASFAQNYKIIRNVRDRLENE